jgi:uncharacterized membrane protein YsdA (DUF1294 family)
MGYWFFLAMSLWIVIGTILKMRKAKDAEEKQKFKMYLILGVVVVVVITIIELYKPKI